MPINGQAIAEAARKAAMDAMERGARAGCQYLVELLQATVSSAGAIPMQGPHGRGVGSPFKYARKGKRGIVYDPFPREWEKAPWEQATRLRDMPPLSRSGAGARSIAYTFIERDDTKGIIRVRIGGDAKGAGTQGGFTTLPGYMTGHELGIRYPTRGPMKGTGPVIQRPWLRSTVNRYWGSFISVVTHVASEV